MFWSRGRAQGLEKIERERERKFSCWARARTKFLSALKLWSVFKLQTFFCPSLESWDPSNGSSEEHISRSRKTGVTKSSITDKDENQPQSSKGNEEFSERHAKAKEKSDPIKSKKQSLADLVAADMENLATPRNQRKSSRGRNLRTPRHLRDFKKN